MEPWNEGQKHLAPILFISLLMRLEQLLRLDPLLLHKQVILDSLKLQEPELAFGVGGDSRKAGP